MSNCRLLVVSCPAREPIQRVWKLCQVANWPDCELSIEILSPTPDRGWNANLVQALDGMAEDFILLMLDDHFVDKGEQYSENIQSLLAFMSKNSAIGLVKLQAGNAENPDLQCPEFPRLREYDRRHHAFKRTNLVPTMFRRDYLKRLCSAVLATINPRDDIGRRGAVEFEVTGTELTENRKTWPERMFGINREGQTDLSLLKCIANDGVREHKLKSQETLQIAPALYDQVLSIPGIRAFIN